MASTAYCDMCKDQCVKGKTGLKIIPVKLCLHNGAARQKKNFIHTCRRAIVAGSKNRDPACCNYYVNALNLSSFSIVQKKKKNT